MNEPTKTAEPTPEQLVQLLDLQLAALRKRREGQQSHRTPANIFLLCVIVLGAAVALWLAMHMLEEMRPSRDAANPPTEIAH